MFQQQFHHGKVTSDQWLCNSCQMIKLGRQLSFTEDIDDVSFKLPWSKEYLFQNKDCFHWTVVICLHGIFTFLCRLADELHMPSLPEMMFGDNILRIQHDRGFGIEFNATDALKCVNNCQGMIKVACAEEWQESRYSILSPVGKYWCCMWNSHKVVKITDWTLEDHVAFMYDHRSHLALLWHDHSVC